MIERQMEDLIAEFPGDFFPRKTLVLKGRQRSFHGVGRFDLLFEDEFQRNILMELKARPARSEDADQLVRYKDELVRLGEKNVQMWLVAPQISTSMREFLDRWGIEYTEVHPAEFLHVAERHNIALDSLEEDHGIRNNWSPSKPAYTAHRDSRRLPSEPMVATGPTVTYPSPLKWNRHGYDLILRDSEAFDEGTFTGLVDAFEIAVPSGKNATLVAELRRWAANAVRSPWSQEACRRLLRWVITGTTWRRAVPAAEAVWVSLFGRPVPEWAIWNSNERRNEIDQEAWRVWYESLPH